MFNIYLANQEGEIFGVAQIDDFKTTRQISWEDGIIQSEKFQFADLGSVTMNMELASEYYPRKLSDQEKAFTLYVVDETKAFKKIELRKEYFHQLIEKITSSVTLTYNNCWLENFSGYNIMNNEIFIEDVIIRIE